MKVVILLFVLFAAFEFTAFAQRQVNKRNKTVDFDNPSPESLANKKHYEILAARMAQTEPSGEYDEDAQWAALSSEPSDVKFSDVVADGVPGMWIVPKGAAEDCVIFYAHGGGFVGGSINTHKKMVGHLAKATGCRALIYDYPLADKEKHPAQINTAVTAYKWLFKQGFKPDHIVFAGDSCGAVIQYGVLQRTRDQRLPLPAAVLMISGWFDMAVTAASFETNRKKDVFFSKETVAWLAKNYLGDTDPRDPLASPLYADLKGFPPVYLQAGADETLVDESRMFAEKAKKAGVEVKIDIFPNMFHSFQMMAGRAPEADEAIARLAKWVRPKLGLKK